MEQLRLETHPEAGGEAAYQGGALWTEEQRRAIDADEPYVFVEAGAGTGKTGVLVDRYCDAVEAAEAGTDAVLAFTFTEKAAGELRGRVRFELRRRAAIAEEAGDHARARRLRELARSPGAWLTTIHGFCRRLLAAHPIAAGVDPGFRVFDQTEADLLAERAFDDAFDALLADPDPAKLTLAAARVRAALRDLVRGAHDELRSLGQERPALEPLAGPDLAGALDELAAAAGEALTEIEAANGSGANGCREKLADATALAAEHRAGGVPDVDAVAKLKITGKRYDGPAVAAYNDAVARAVERLAADLYEALRTLVALYGERYAELKAERSGLDFEDLQLGAIRVLRDSTAVREAWRDRFSDVLVDEFQDTNRIQVELIEQLRGPGTRLFTVGDEFQAIYGFRHADVSVFRAERERATSMPLRGNFRSDPGVLAAANALGEALLPGYRPLLAGRAEPARKAGGPPVEMLVVERGGWDAPGVGLADRGELDAPADRVAEAGHLARRLAELARPEEEGGAGIPRGEMVLLLRAFTHVTAYEEALERAGLRPLVVGGRGYWSHQQVEDMRSLLAVAANPLDDAALLGALASPACAVSPDALWLLRRATGGGRHLWPTVEKLGSGSDPVPDPADEPDPERAAELARRREAAEAIPADDAAKLRDFCERLGRLRSRAPLLPLDELVDAAARAFDYDLAALQRERGRRRWANVRKLMALARDYERASGRDLAGFVALLRDRSERDDREPEAQTEVEGHDGVRVMTVHNAKGLEFGVVAGADLGRDLGAGGFAPAFRARGDAGGDGIRFGVRLARAGGPSLKLFELDDLAAEASEEESAEDRRLAYVAATRAEHRLLLSGVVDRGALEKCAAEDSPPARASVLLRMLTGLGIAIDDDGLAAAEARLPGAEVEIAADAASATATVPPPETLPGLGIPERGSIGVRLLRPAPGIGSELLAIEAAAEAEEVVRVDRRSPLAVGNGRPPRRLDAPHLSNAALELYGRCGYRFYVERMLGLRPLDVAEGGEGALAFGSAVHSLLEWSARNRWLEPPAEHVRAALARAGLEASAETAGRAMEFVGGWLGSELRSGLERHARLAPEAPFLLEIGGAVVRGQLDLLVRDPAGPPLVVDYKTNALRSREPAELMDRYETQRDLYALAAATAAGAEEARTAFVFLERPGEPVVREHDAAAIAATRERLGSLVAGIAGGEFEVTHRPHRELCQDCPARPRLCVHPPELTLREPEA
jgi:ATP-dependent helicase/nuclease subunit A